MAVLLVSQADSLIQLFSILIIFVVILAASSFATKFIAGYRKNIESNSNIEIIETTKISNNKYIQLIRIGANYKAIAVSRDQITFLGDIPKEDIRFNENCSTEGFNEIFSKVLNKTFTKNDKPKD